MRGIEHHLGGPVSSIFIRKLPHGGRHSLLGAQVATDHGDVLRVVLGKVYLLVGA